MTGPVNVRDVGGLPLVGGGVTRRGVLLRGDALYDGDEPPAHVTWPPATVIDLRSAKERDRSPYTWPEGVAIVSRELFDAADLGRMPREGALMSVYRELVANAGPGIAGLLDVMGDGPTYLHCAAGKDRTGASVAALLLLAGVPEEAVVADYQRTESAMGGVLARLVERGAIDVDGWQPEWAEAPYEAVGLVIEAVTGHPDGPRGWFLENGATDAAIDRFLGRFI
ncbi:tyrosine-protein phosphatase [Nocardioides sp. WS12]|uniref:tyrosine-protein phosphatase n=1 Tax=Nocardioides sp. WS12 TaxID=2486272 RepID=UPI0015FDD415|nr:tyrosine-protein phosphatase [Nocardioides sp. WS12]